MSIGAITKVFATCPEEKSEYLVLIAMADQADDDGGNIWFKWETIAHKARIDERTAQMIVGKLIEKGRVGVEVGGAPRGYDLYHIVFPDQPYTRATFQKNRAARRLEKRATGRTAYGKKRKGDPSEEAPETPSENFSIPELGTESEDSSGKSENFSQKPENFSFGTTVPRPPSAAGVAPETSLTRPLNRGVLHVVEDAREATAVAQPMTAPVAEPSPDPRTTFSASPLKDEALPLPPALGTPITSPAVVPSVAVLEPPVGGTADAVDEGDAISLEELAWLSGGENGQATDTENVPGGGAAGAAPAPEAPRGALLPAVALGVAHLVPVPRDELLSRPVAPLDSEQLRTIRTMVTGKLIRDGLLDQLTPTGGLSREDWLRLTLDELEVVKRAAQADAQAKIGGFTTQVIDGLDRMIGGGQKAKASQDRGGAANPATVAQYDPRLAAGQRCALDGQLGVVATVTNAHYWVVLDDGERHSIDRALKAQLQRLVASDAPAAALVPQQAPVPAVLADVGSQWQPRAGGDMVTVKRVEGTQRHLSNGTSLAVFLLVSKYERVGA